MDALCLDIFKLNQYVVQNSHTLGVKATWPQGKECIIWPTVSHRATVCPACPVCLETSLASPGFATISAKHNNELTFEWVLCSDCLN